jgi:hypothetical protein
MSQEAPAATETPSADEGAPELEGQTPEIEEGTPPEEGEVEGAEAAPETDETPEETPGDPQTPPGFEKLRAKYPNLSDEEFQEVVAEHYWSTTKEISSREKRIRELEMELAAREEAATPEEPETPPTNPQIERLDQRIKSLYDRGQTFQKEQQELLTALPKIEREIAKAEARIEDAGDGEYADSAKLSKWESVKTQQESKRDATVRQLRDLHYKREQADFEMETLLADKDWMTKVAEQQRQQQKLEQQSTQQFNAEFPQYVDSLIDEAANSMGAPKDAKIRESLWKHVNRATTMDFWSMARQGLDHVDVPELVKGHVKEYLEDRDLVGRVKFQEKSKAKLKVAGKAPRAGTARSGAPKPPVSVTQLNKGDLTPGMSAARKYLASKGL